MDQGQLRIRVCGRTTLDRVRGGKRCKCTVTAVGNAVQENEALQAHWSTRGVWCCHALLYWRSVVQCGGKKHASGGSYILNVYTVHGSSAVSHCLHMGFPYMSGTLHVIIAGTCDSNAYTKQRNVASACFVTVLKMMTECGFPFRCCGFREANYVRINITSNTLCTCEIKG